MDVNSLRQVTGFHLLPEEALVRLAKRTTWKIYKQDARIADPAEEGPNLLIVAEGAAAVLVRPLERRPVELLSLCKGEILDPDDLAEVLRDDACLEARSEATAILRLPSALYDREMFIGEAAQRSRRQLRGQTQEVTRQLWEGFYGAHLTRLEHELYRLWEDDPGHEVRLTHAELTARIGVHREDVTKMPRGLRERKVIHFEPHRRGIHILAPEALAPQHRRGRH